MRAVLCLLLLTLLSGCAMLADKSGKMLLEEQDADGNITSIKLWQPEGAKDATRWTRHPDGTIELEFGAQYNFGKIKAAFAAMRPWTYLGISLVLLGAWMAYSKKHLNRWSVGLIVGGMSLGVFAHVVPAMSVWVTGGMLLLLVGGVGYMVWNKGLRTPVPNDFGSRR